MTAQKNEIIEANKRNMERQDDEVGLTFSEEEIETIKNTVASDANTHELNMFLSIAKRYGLDPFNKEIFFWKYKGKPQIMTSRDGNLQIADRHPQYDGLVSDVVREQDNFRRKSDGIDHEYGTDRGEIVGAYALVYRKDRRYPVYVFAPFDEYDAGSRVWKQYPSAMILKVAESMALKRAFTISGLVSREEMEVTRLQEESTETKETTKERIKERGSSSSPISDVDVADSNNNAGNFNKDKVKANKDDNDDGLSEREKEINDMISENLEVKDELKKELFSYLSHIKEKSDLEKISLNDLTDDEFDELKNILIQIKSLLEKSA